MATALQVAVIGECMVELQKSGELFKQTFGGDTLNSALYLARLTHKQGVVTRYLTGLGQDPFSQYRPCRDRRKTPSRYVFN